MGKKSKRFKKLQRQQAHQQNFVGRSLADLATTVRMAPTVLAGTSESERRAMPTVVASPEGTKRALGHAAAGASARLNQIAKRLTASLRRSPGERRPDIKSSVSDSEAKSKLLQLKLNAQKQFKWSGKPMGTKFKFFGKKFGSSTVMGDGIKRVRRIPTIFLILAALLATGGYYTYSKLSHVNWSRMTSWASPTRWLETVSGVQHSSSGRESRSMTTIPIKGDTYWTRGAAFGDGKVKVPVKKTLAEKKKTLQKERAFRKLPASEKRRVWKGKLAEIRKVSDKPGYVKQTAYHKKNVAHNSKGKAHKGKKKKGHGK